MGEKSFLVILSGQNCTLRTSAVRLKVCGKILVRVFFGLYLKERCSYDDPEPRSIMLRHVISTKNQENILRKLLADIDGGSIWIVGPITTYLKIKIKYI